MFFLVLLSFFFFHLASQEIANVTLSCPNLQLQQISDSRLCKPDSKPTMEVLQSFFTKEKAINIIEEIASSWKKVATQLNFSTAQINTLQVNTANYPDPNGDACFAMLQNWLKNPNATWAILARAIRFSSESLTTLANDIEEALK